MLDVLYRWTTMGDRKKVMKFVMVFPRGSAKHQTGLNCLRSSYTTFGGTLLRVRRLGRNGVVWLISICHDTPWYLQSTQSVSNYLRIVPKRPIFIQFSEWWNEFNTTMEFSSISSSSLSNKCAILRFFFLIGSWEYL